MVVFLVVMLKYLTRSNSREGVLGDAAHHGGQFYFQWGRM